MGSEVTVNLQYGNTSMYNEIEHSDPQSDNNELTKPKVKVCQDLPQFIFAFNETELGHKKDENDKLNTQFILSYPSPPPEFV